MYEAICCVSQSVLCFDPPVLYFTVPYIPSKWDLSLNVTRNCSQNFLSPSWQDTKGSLSEVIRLVNVPQVQIPRLGRS